MGLLKKLAGETVLYGVSSIVGRVLNYLLVPLYTAVFAPAEYGIVTELYAYVAFLNVIYVYGLETAYFRFSTKEGANEATVFSTAVSSIILTSLLLSGSMILFSEEISIILNYPDQSQLITWLACILAIDAIVAIPFAKLRLQHKARYFVFAKLTNISLNIALNVLFILILPSSSFADQSSFYNPNWGIEYIFISNLIANATLILLLAGVFKGFKPKLDLHQLKPLLIYAYPILFTGLAGVTNEMLSRAMLKHWLPEGFYPDQSNLTALGIFGACYKLSVFMTLAVQAFRYAAEPFFFSRAADKDSPKLFAEVAHWFIIFGAFAFLVISTNLDLLGYIFLRSAEYREGLNIVPYLLMGGLFLGIYYNLSVWYKLTDKTIYGAIISGVGALITIFANLLLIPILGYLGSAIATLATYFGMTLLSYSLGQKHFPVPYKVIKGICYIGLAVILVIGSNAIDGTLPTTITLRIVAVLMFLLSVFLFERKALHTTDQ